MARRSRIVRQLRWLALSKNTIKWNQLKTGDELTSTDRDINFVEMVDGVPEFKYSLAVRRKLLTSAAKLLTVLDVDFLTYSFEINEARYENNESAYDARAEKLISKFAGELLKTISTKDSPVNLSEGLSLQSTSSK